MFVVDVELTLVHYQCLAQELPWQQMTMGSILTTLQMKMETQWTSILEFTALFTQVLSSYCYRTAVYHLCLHTVPPQCHSIEYTFMDNIHTLSCVSYNSPPTNVIWERDGKRIYFNDTSYQSSQILMNRTTSAYNNTLTINATIEDVIGEYSCTVSNDLGSSYETTTVKGEQSVISPLIVTKMNNA